MPGLQKTTHLGDSLAIQTHDNSAHGFISMVNVEVDLQGVSSCSRAMGTNVKYLVSDLGTTRFLLCIFSLDQREADCKD